jgi:hypothetical protein
MAIIFRNEKGSPLTHEELDKNFKFPHKWRQSIPYTVGEIVSYNYSFYECTIAHTSTSVFDGLKFVRYTAVASISGNDGITYIWTDALQQAATSASTNERGVRVDIIGRPVYYWDGLAWYQVEDPNNAGQYYLLDGDADIIGFSNPLYPTFTTVGEALGGALYVDMSVALGITTTTQFEIGTTVVTLDLAWSIVDGDGVQTQQLSWYEPISTNSGSPITPTYPTNTVTLVDVITETRIYTLTVDDNTNTVAASATLHLLPKLYWGNAAEPMSYNSAFILSLPNDILASSKSATLNVTAGLSEYVYFALPSSYGTPIFSFNGIIGGFELVDTLSLTNASGHTQNYDIYRSDYSQLGAIEIITT